MANLHIGRHVIHVRQSLVEFALVEAIWAVTAFSVAVLLYEGLFT